MFFKHFILPLWNVRPVPYPIVLEFCWSVLFPCPTQSLSPFSLVFQGKIISAQNNIRMGESSFPPSLPSFPSTSFRSSSPSQSISVNIQLNANKYRGSSCSASINFSPEMFIFPPENFGELWSLFVSQFIFSPSYTSSSYFFSWFSFSLDYYFIIFPIIIIIFPISLLDLHI